MQILLAHVCLYLGVDSADHSLWCGNASLSSLIGDAVSVPSQDFAWDVPHRVTPAAVRTPQRIRPGEGCAVALMLNLPVDSLPLWSKTKP